MDRLTTNWHACFACKRACGVRLLEAGEKMPPLPVDPPENIETRYVSQCCGAIVEIKSS